MKVSDIKVIVSQMSDDELKQLTRRQLRNMMYILSPYMEKPSGPVAMCKDRMVKHLRFYMSLHCNENFANREWVKQRYKEIRSGKV